MIPIKDKYFWVQSHTKDFQSHTKDFKNGTWYHLA